MALAYRTIQFFRAAAMNIGLALAPTVYCLAGLRWADDSNEYDDDDYDDRHCHFWFSL